MSNIAVAMQVINRIINTGRMNVIEQYGLSEEHIIDPVAKNIYVAIKEYYNKYDPHQVPSREALSALLSPQEYDFLLDAYCGDTLTDAELRDKLWEDYAFHKATSVIQQSAKLLETDSIQAVNYLQTNLEPLQKTIGSIGEDIVATASKRLDVYKEKQNNADWFYPSGFDKLDEHIGGFSPGEDLVVLFARTGVGKEQPLYSKVLTPNGFISMGDVKLGQSVITGTGNVANVIAIFPQGTKPVYELTFNDGTKVRAGLEHLWEVNKVHAMGIISRYSELMTTQQLMKNPSKWAVPLVKPFDMKCDYTLSTSEAKFLSMIAGFYKPTIYQKSGIVYIQTSSAFLEEVDCENVVIRVDGCVDRGDMGQLIIKLSSSNELSKLLLKCARGDILDTGEIVNILQKLPYDKRVVSIETIFNMRGILCRRLLADHSQHILVGSDETNIRESYAELIRSVGGWASTTETPGCVTFRWKPCCKLYKKLVSVEYVEDSMCQCIMVDDPSHTYVTDNYTVTHNTWILTKMLYTSWRNNYNVGLVEPEMTSTKIGYRFDTIHKHFSNKDLMYGRKLDQGPDDYEKYIDTLPQSSSAAFKVAHPKEFSGDITVSKIKQWCLAENIKILGIDGISYIKDERALPGDNTTTALTHISADLMELSIQLRIPVLIVVQSNREGTANGGKLALENIRDSDGIAYSASKVIGLYKKNDALHMELLKNRDAESGLCLVYDWDINTGKFQFIQEGEMDSEQSNTDTNSTHSYSAGSNNSESRPSRVSDSSYNRMSPDESEYAF